MVSVRRVVTGHDAQGRARIVTDESVPLADLPGVKGWAACGLWGADGPERLPGAGDRPATTPGIPPVGGYRLLQFTMAPHTAAGHSDATLAAPAVRERVASVLDEPGMHHTASIDFIHVLEGRCLCAFPSGEEVCLAPGDLMVQNGTLHAWSNPFDEPCRILTVQVGAHHDALGDFSTMR